jgi:hypothetical protein
MGRGILAAAAAAAAVDGLGWARPVGRFVLPPVHASKCCVVSSLKNQQTQKPKNTGCIPLQLID